MLKKWLQRTELISEQFREFCEKEQKTQNLWLKNLHRCQHRHNFIFDDFDKFVLRRTVQTMYEKKKVLLTLNNIMEMLIRKIEFSGGLSTLSKVLKSLGFSYKRCSQNRKVLMERTDGVSHRIRFLRQIKTFREQGRPIIYTDITCSVNVLAV